MRLTLSTSFERDWDDAALIRTIYVEAVADVDLESETVTFVSCVPPLSELTEREREQLAWDFEAEALSLRRVQGAGFQEVYS